MHWPMASTYQLFNVYPNTHLIFQYMCKQAKNAYTNEFSIYFSSKAKIYTWSVVMERQFYVILRIL